MIIYYLIIFFKMFIICLTFIICEGKNVKIIIFRFFKLKNNLIFILAIQTK